MTVLKLIALAIVSVVLLGRPALADKRVALVVGNSGYQHVGRLLNPAKDATSMTSVLKDAGFDVVESRRDLGMAEMRRALRNFADTARDADVAVVYYAGHGIEIDGTNYVIPVDATLERDLDIYDEAFPLERILAVVEPAKKLRLVILDACRDNPFAKTMKRTVASRSVGRGLAKVEPASPNTLIAFASKAGSTASDGDNANSPFTAALVKHIATPGLDLRKAFGFVRDEVMKTTGNRQEPYVYGSLGGNDVPLVDAKPTATPSKVNPNFDVRRDYELALEVGTREVWTAFIAQYPSGLYATLAKGQLNKIAAEEMRVAATEKARLAQEDKARLAAEGARQAEQQKAAALAEAAERAKAAAERAKQIEQDKAAAAEKARAERERIVLEKATAAQAEAEKIAAKKRVAEQAAADKRAADQLAADAKSKEKPPEQLAALSPDAPTTKPEAKATDLVRSIQSELRRVGCFTGTVNSEWTASARRSLEKFNKGAGLKLDVKLASLDALDAIKLKPSRICPLECERGFRASGEACVKITCAAGSFVNDDNECEKKREKPVASRGDDKPKRERPEPGSQKPVASGQILCTLQGCRPVSKGCRIITRSNNTGGQLFSQEVCN